MIPYEDLKVGMEVEAFDWTNGGWVPAVVTCVRSLETFYPVGITSTLPSKDTQVGARTMHELRLKQEGAT